MHRIIALVLVALVLAACGTKGALYLPPAAGEETPGAKKK